MSRTRAGVSSPDLRPQTLAVVHRWTSCGRNGRKETPRKLRLLSRRERMMHLELGQGRKHRSEGVQGAFDRKKRKRKRIGNL